MEAKDLKLKLFTPASLEAITVGRVGLTLRISGVFSISSTLAEIMGVQKGDKVLIGQNPDAPLEMFLMKHPEGFIIRCPNGKQKTLGFTNNKLRNIIIKTCKLEDKTYSFLVSKSPVEIGGIDCYAIITSSAKNK